MKKNNDYIEILEYEVRVKFEDDDKIKKIKITFDNELHLNSIDGSYVVIEWKNENMELPYFHTPDKKFKNTHEIIQFLIKNQESKDLTVTVRPCEYLKY